jgi:hypothetical protein
MGVQQAKRVTKMNTFSIIIYRVNFIRLAADYI